jgi:hypothetical protein
MSFKTRMGIDKIYIVIYNVFGIKVIFGVRS